ncbi:MAG TPA: DUF2723 domain-containing protein [Gemmatimonadaceae bacterium]
MRDKNLSRWSWIVPVVVLGAGYADLIRGGITASAILLATGYLVAVPWVLLSGSRADGERPAYREATVAGAAVLGLYVLTLSPTTAMWDASEYIAAAYTFGIPHPPGNPLFVIVGRVFSVLPIAPNVAMRVNVLAAVSSAVAAAVWYLVARRVAVRAGLGPAMSRLTAALSTLIGATAFTVWNQSVVNEKVYTVSLAGIALVSWLMLRWSDAPDGPRADRLLLVVAYLLGLGYANHMAGMLPLPAVALIVLHTRPRTLFRWRLLAAAAAMVFIGLTPFATQPVRAAFNPPINEGEPTACRQGLQFSCTFSRGTWDAFRYNFNREQFGKPALDQRQAPFAAQVGMWWLYFKWQWWRDAHNETSAALDPGAHERRHDLQSVVAALFFVLAMTGGAVHYRHDRRGFWYFGPLMLSMSVVLIYYLNFKYGASQAPELTAVEREVRDRDYFFLWSFSAWGVWAGLGLVWLWRSLASPGVSAASSTSSRLRVAATAPVLLLALIPLAGNRADASRRNDRVASSFARDLLNSVEPYGVLVTGGDNDTFPLWYAQEVEGVRRDVTVAVTSLMNTDWFARGMIRRPIHRYDAERGPAVYRDKAWPIPTGPPLHLTLDEADSMPPYLIVPQPLRFQARGLDIRIDPRLLPQTRDGGLLERSDLLVLRMIADTWPQRPVYISRTAGAYGEMLGLGNNLLSQGLARKVVPTPVASRDTVYVPGSGWVDIQRTHALWRDFEGPRAIVRRNDWIDQPSISIAFSYLFAGSELASLLSDQRDMAAADSVLAGVRQVARAVRVDHLMSDAIPPPAPLADTSR